MEFDENDIHITFCAKTKSILTEDDVGFDWGKNAYYD